MNYQIVMEKAQIPLQVRIIHTFLFEVISFTLIAFFMHEIIAIETVNSVIFAVACSICAVVWNFIYCILFDYVESKYINFSRKNRTIRTRIVHTIVYEFTFMLFSLSLLYLLTDMPIFDAFKVNIILIPLFLFYTYTFNFLFDRFYWRRLFA